MCFYQARSVVEAPRPRRERSSLSARDRCQVVEFIDVPISGEQQLTANQSPWQNPYVERLHGSVRRECLDHVIVFNEGHLRRILRSYFAYYHEDRTHLGLGKETPMGRPVSSRVSPTSTLVELPRVGGLHRRYEWSEAA